MIQKTKRVRVGVPARQKLSNLKTQIAQVEDEEDRKMESFRKKGDGINNDKIISKALNDFAALHPFIDKEEFDEAYQGDHWQFISQYITDIPSLILRPTQSWHKPFFFFLLLEDEEKENVIGLPHFLQFKTLSHLHDILPFVIFFDTPFNISIF